MKKDEKKSSRKISIIILVMTLNRHDKFLFIPKRRKKYPSRKFENLIEIAGVNKL
jgi:hypothetical protein